MNALFWYFFWSTLNFRRLYMVYFRKMLQQVWWVALDDRGRTINIQGDECTVFRFLYCLSIPTCRRVHGRDSSTNIRVNRYRKLQCGICRIRRYLSAHFTKNGFVGKCDLSQMISGRECCVLSVCFTSNRTLQFRCRTGLLPGKLWRCHNWQWKWQPHTRLYPCILTPARRSQAWVEVDPCEPAKTINWVNVSLVSWRNGACLGKATRSNVDVDAHLTHGHYLRKQ